MHIVSVCKQANTSRAKSVFRIGNPTCIQAKHADLIRFRDCVLRTLMGVSLSDLQAE